MLQPQDRELLRDVYNIAIRPLETTAHDEAEGKEYIRNFEQHVDSEGGSHGGHGTRD